MRSLSASQSQDRKRDLQGNQAWGNRGIAISLMGSFPVTPYDGSKFDTNVAVFIPHDETHLPALFAYFVDPAFSVDLRRVDGALKLTNSSIKAVSFDHEHWQDIAAEKYPDGLPEPESDDPTQWIFHGRPEYSSMPLQVAVARLLGYQWPAETDATMRLSQRSREMVERCAELSSFCCGSDFGVVGGRPGLNKKGTSLSFG